MRPPTLHPSKRMRPLTHSLATEKDAVRRAELPSCIYIRAHNTSSVTRYGGRHIAARDARSPARASGSHSRRGLRPCDNNHERRRRRRRNSEGREDPYELGKQSVVLSRCTQTCTDAASLSVRYRGWDRERGERGAGAHHNCGTGRGVKPRDGEERRGRQGRPSRRHTDAPTDTALVLV